LSFQRLTESQGVFLQTTSQDRHIIFISHSTPEDNDFTVWLASRLQADGYEVWIDKQALLGGEKFWQDIDQVIRKKAIKFLLVYSENICYQKQRGILKDGVNKEKSLAESIAKDNSLNDFIVLLNVDGSEYNLFIGADMLNQIPFYESWASGYSQLQKKFKKDGIEPVPSLVGDFSRWYEDEYVISKGVKEMREIYYDSWWPVPQLPETFYMYVFANDVIAKEVQQQLQYPASRITNIVATFFDAPDFEITMEGQTGKIGFTCKYEIKVSDVLVGAAREGFPSTRDAANHFRSLLQESSISSCVNVASAGIPWPTINSLISSPPVLILELKSLMAGVSAKEPSTKTSSAITLVTSGILHYPSNRYSLHSLRTA